MKRVSEIMWLFMRARIRAATQYRAAFWVDTFCFLFGYGTQALLMYLMVWRFDTLGGWKPFEVMMLYAYVLASYTLSGAFLAGVMWGLPRRIRMGDFDQSLTKPMHPLAYEIASSFSDYYFLHFLLALGMIALCAVNLGIRVSVFQALVALVSIVGGALIQGGVYILLSSASFVLINNPLGSNLYNNIRPMIEYPISVFPKAIQFLLSAVVPLAFASFYPAQNLLGKRDFLFFPPAAQYLSLPIGILFFLVANWVWNRSMRAYKSTGS